MKRTARVKSSLSRQMKRHSMTKSEVQDIYSGNTETMISTGSTLLDLAISGGRKKGGGLPSGILVEVFGPSSTGKTVFLSEIAGAIQRQGGEVMFHDPEARLDKQFARLFDLNMDEVEYTTPDTVPEVFAAIRKWKPKDNTKIHGCMADSLAALSTNLEMGSEEGDKMGMRRAKELSEELRKTTRIIAKNNLLMVASNQIRVNKDAMFGNKYKTPGGEAVGFYASVRLRTNLLQKLKKKIRVAGKEVIRVIGVEVQVEVFKNSVWSPFRKELVSILFDYGIDDVRQNLQWLKRNTGASTYVLRNKKLDVSLEKSIAIIEANDWESRLKKEVIKLWMEIDAKFASNRIKKR